MIAQDTKIYQSSLSLILIALYLRLLLIISLDIKSYDLYDLLTTNRALTIG